MMKTLACVAALVGFGLVVPVSAAAQPTNRDAWVQGQQSAASGRWEEARQAYELAWSREHSADVAAALGHAELQLGLPVRAAEHLSLALESMSDESRVRPEPFFDLVEARRLVTTLRVSARPGATVIVDGNVIGQAPITRPIFVDAGRHTIRVELAGWNPAEHVFDGRMGEEVRADFGLVRSTATPTTESHDPAPLPASTGKNPWIIGAGAVAGTATLAVGLGYGVAAITSDKHQDQHNVNAGVIGTLGGAILIATITYALWPSSTPPLRTGLSGAPLVLDKGGGLGFDGSF